MKPSFLSAFDQFLHSPTVDQATWTPGQRYQGWTQTGQACVGLGGLSWKHQLFYPKVVRYLNAVIKAAKLEATLLEDREVFHVAMVAQRALRSDNAKWKEKGAELEKVLVAAGRVPDCSRPTCWDLLETIEGMQALTAPLASHVTSQDYRYVVLTQWMHDRPEKAFVQGADGIPLLWRGLVVLDDQDWSLEEEKARLPWTRFEPKERKAGLTPSEHMPALATALLHPLAPAALDIAINKLPLYGYEADALWAAVDSAYPGIWTDIVEPPTTADDWLPSLKRGRFGLFDRLAAFRRNQALETTLPGQSATPQRPRM